MVGKKWQENGLWHDSYFQRYLNFQIYAGHLESISAVAIAPCTKSFIVSGSSDKNIKIWDLVSVFK
jgi:WD40 repeat protein